MISKEIESAVDQVIREEYGGCRPHLDNPCILKARIKDKVFQVFVVGKWRPMMYYGPKGKIPSKKLQEQAVRTIRCNTGKTFEGKEVIFNWVKE